MLRNKADARRCSYFELGLPVLSWLWFDSNANNIHTIICAIWLVIDVSIYPKYCAKTWNWVQNVAKLSMTDSYAHACTHDRIQKPVAEGFYWKYCLTRRSLFGWQQKADRLNLISCATNIFLSLPLFKKSPGLHHLLEISKYVIVVTGIHHGRRKDLAFYLLIVSFPRHLCLVEFGRPVRM